MKRLGGPAPGTAARLLTMSRVRLGCEELGEETVAHLVHCLKMQVAVDSVYQVALKDAADRPLQMESTAKMLDEWLFFGMANTVMATRHVMDALNVPRDKRVKCLPFILMALIGMDYEIATKSIEEHNKTPCEDPTCWFDILLGPAIVQ